MCQEGDGLIDTYTGRSIAIQHHDAETPLFGERSALYAEPQAELFVPHADARSVRLLAKPG